MHEYHAVQALVDRLSADASVLEGERIAEVRIRAGATLSREALEQAYEMLAPDTPLEGSRLVVVTARDDRLCPTCGRSWSATHDDVAGHLLICPSCGSLSPIEHGAGIEVLEVTSRPVASRG
jgi:Zn finger protein HypA/HybF involved in hydrogenase expression